MARVVETFDVQVPRAGTVPSSMSNDTGVKIESKHLVGIEVEVENYLEDSGRLNPIWSKKEDGSLRNNGAEFVTKPIPACSAPAALQYLLKDFLPKDACFSPRTSIHVHLDFHNDEYDTVVDTLLLYSVFEKVLFRFIGKGRIRNIYCVPITTTQLLTDAAMRGGFQPRYWEKYASLNLKTIATFGTLEFRHMHGTFDARKVSIWIDLLTKMKDYCLRMGTKHIRAIISSMDDNFDFKQLMLDVFGESSEYLKLKSIDDVHMQYHMVKQSLCKRGTVNDLGANLSTTSKLLRVKA